MLKIDDAQLYRDLEVCILQTRYYDNWIFTWFIFESLLSLMLSFIIISKWFYILHLHIIVNMVKMSLLISDTCNYSQVWYRCSLVLLTGTLFIKPRVLFKLRKQPFDVLRNSCF